MFSLYVIIRSLYCFYTFLSLFSMSRLSLPDFKKGFVLQTLNNMFFKNEITTLLALLDIVGHVEYSLFVTFMNSMDKYIRRMDKLRELEGGLYYVIDRITEVVKSWNSYGNRTNTARKLMEETDKRIQKIDEMWLSEYELLAEDEKKFYLESTLPIKKQEALKRRTQFLQQITELRGRKVLTLILLRRYTISIFSLPFPRILYSEIYMAVDNVFILLFNIDNNIAIFPSLYW